MEARSTTYRQTNPLNNKKFDDWKAKEKNIVFAYPAVGKKYGKDSRKKVISKHILDRLLDNW